VSSFEPRDERLARNQSTFRDINERLGMLRPAAHDDVPLEEFLCECAHDACVEQISMTPAELDDVRSSPVTFAVFPAEEHVFPEVERVVSRSDRFWVVEKQGAAGEVARAESRAEASDGGGDHEVARQGPDL
jgi:hypothetical protein